MVMSHQTKTGFARLPYASIAVLAGLVFWTPDLLLKAFFPQTSPVVILTVVCPLVSLIFYGILRAKSIDNRKRWLPVTFLLGVWFLTSPMIVAATLLSCWSSGAKLPEGLPLVLLMGLLPPYALMMMTYDGSLLAFILVVLLCGAGTAWRLKRSAPFLAP